MRTVRSSSRLCSRGGVPGPGGGTCPGGVYLVPGGGLYLPRGVPAQVLPPCEQNDRQV